MNQSDDKTLQAIDTMLHPRSICIFGATESKPITYGGRFIQCLIGTKYKGRIYPINPRYKEVFGIPCYPDLSSLPEVPDLAGIVVPYDSIRQVITDCGKKEVKSAVIITGQFAELGTSEHIENQKWLGDFARSSGVRLCGPNCLGIANVTDSIWPCSSTVDVISKTIPGNLALVSQSGACAFGPFLQRAQARRIGLAYIVSTGNEADLQVPDFMRYCLHQPNVKGIIVYFEGVKDGEKFRTVAEEALEMGKPIVALKVGRSGAGQAAARSHTASMTGSDEVIDAFFEQMGITRIEDWDELVEIGACLIKARPLKKKAVAIISSSGGVTTQIADKCEQVVGIPPASPATREGLARILGGFGSAGNPAGNPADVTGRAATEDFVTILNLMLKDDAFGGLVLGVAGGEEQAKRIMNAARGTDKPIFQTWIANEQATEGLAALQQSSDVSVFYRIENMVKGLRAVAKYHDRRNKYQSGELKPPVFKPVSVNDIISGSGNLELRKGMELLSRFGIPTARTAVAGSAGEAEKIAEDFNFPVVVKAEMPHKTDKGLVKTNLASKSAVRTAYYAVAGTLKASPEMSGYGVLIQEMVKGGIEVIIGVKNDPIFGPAVLFGMGGVLTEVMKDVSLRVCPLSLTDVREMISEVKGFRLLKGFRGQGACDIAALEETLLKVSSMAYQIKDRLVELDINPVIVLPEGQGVRAVDALVVLK